LRPTDFDVVASLVLALHALAPAGAPARRAAERPLPPGSAASAASASHDDLATPLQLLPLPPSAGPPTVRAAMAAAAVTAFRVAAEEAEALADSADAASLESALGAALRGAKGALGPPGAAAAWLDALGAGAPHLAALLAREPRELPRLLALLGAGLASAGADTAAAAAHAAAGLARALRANAEEGPGLPGVAAAWFASPHGGALPLLVPPLRAAAGDAAGRTPLAAAFRSDGTGGLDAPLAALLVDRFCRGELRAFFAVHLPACAPDPAGRMAALACLLRRLAERGARLRRAFGAAGAAGAAAADALPFAQPSRPPALRAAALSALAALWASFSEATEAAPDAARGALAALKAAARGAAPGAGADAPAAALAVHAHACLHALLHALIAAGSPFAPVVFKALVFSSVEHHATPPVRDAALESLHDVVERHPDVPVASLVEPLARRMGRLGLCAADGPLLDALAHHPRLDGRGAAALLDAVAAVASRRDEPLAAVAATAAVALAPAAAASPAGFAALGRIAAAAVAGFAAEAAADAAPLEGMSREAGIALLMRFAGLDTSTVGDALRPAVEAAAAAASEAGRPEPELELVLQALSGALRPEGSSRGGYAPRPSSRGGASEADWDDDADEDTAAAAAAAAAAAVMAAEEAAAAAAGSGDEGEEAPPPERRAAVPARRSASGKALPSPRAAPAPGRAAPRAGAAAAAPARATEGAPRAAAAPAAGRAGRASEPVPARSVSFDVPPPAAAPPRAPKPSSGAESLLSSGTWASVGGLGEDDEDADTAGHWRGRADTDDYIGEEGDYAEDGEDAFGGGGTSPGPGGRSLRRQGSVLGATAVQADIEAARRRAAAALESARLEYERARLASAHMRERLAKRRNELVAKGRKPFWDRVLTLPSAAVEERRRKAAAAAAANANRAWNAGAAGKTLRPTPLRLTGDAAGTATQPPPPPADEPPTPTRARSGPEWAQQLIIEALNLRLATDPEHPLPEGFERVAVEESGSSASEEEDDDDDDDGEDYPPRASSASSTTGAVTALMEDMLLDATGERPRRRRAPRPPREPRPRRTRYEAKAVAPLVVLTAASAAAAAAAAAAAPARPAPARTVSPQRSGSMRAGAPGTGKPPPQAFGLQPPPEPVLGPDGLFPFERPPQKYIQAAIEGMMGTICETLALAAVHRDREMALRSARAAAIERNMSPEKKGAAPRGASPDIDPVGLAHARGAAALAARMEELKNEERVRRAKAAEKAAAEKEGNRAKHEAARAVAAVSAQERAAKKAAAEKAKAERDAAAAAREKEEAVRLRRRLEEDKKRVAAFQAKQKAEADARAAEAERKAAADAERKAEELARGKKMMAAKGRALGQVQPMRSGRAADALRRAAELADERACDDALDAILREFVPPPRNAYASVKPRLLSHIQQ